MKNNSVRDLQDIARALVDAAQESGALPTVVAQVASLRAAFATNPEFARAFQSSHLGFLEKREKISFLLKDVVHSLVVNAVLLLAEKNMEHQIEASLDAVVDCASRKGEMHLARVQTPHALTAEEKQTLIKKLEKKFGGTYQLEELIVPELLGGFTVQVGDWRFDATLRGALKRMNHALYV